MLSDVSPLLLRPARSSLALITSSDIVTCPHHVSFRRFTVARRSLYGLLCFVMVFHTAAHLGAIQVLHNADGGGGCQIFRKKTVRRCKVQRY